ncbi:MAG: hypothetical protein H6Q38_2940 [Chloroflexi bacterium]|nr:hypothetical protein [Chloroflexota bacterium]
MFIDPKRVNYLSCNDCADRENKTKIVLAAANVFGLMTYTVQ